MSISHLLDQTASRMFAGLEPVVPAAAQTAVEAYELTAGRFWSLPAILLGLAGTVFAGTALIRKARRPGNGPAPRAAIIALVTGPLGAVIGGLVVLAADGGPGTGGGIVGGYLAILLGLIGTVLGGVALARSRRADTPATAPRMGR